MKASLTRAVGAMIGCLVIAGCQAGPGPVDEGALTRLSAPEIREALVDNSLYREGGNWFRRWEYAGLFRADGALSARVWWNGGEERATGVWEVTNDDLYCRTWHNNWGEGKRGCFRVSKAGEILVFDYESGSSGDADRYAYELLQGNPYDL